MVSTKNLKVLDHETDIYTSLHRYGDAIRYIFRMNNVDAKIAMTNRHFENEKDEEIRKYWAKRFETAGNHRYISPNIMLRIRTHFDPDELFDFLINAIETDADVQKYVADFEGGPHIPDPGILE